MRSLPLWGRLSKCRHLRKSLPPRSGEGGPLAVDEGPDAPSSVACGDSFPLEGEAFEIRRCTSGNPVGRGAHTAPNLRPSAGRKKSLRFDSAE